MWFTGCFICAVTQIGAEEMFVWCLSREAARAAAVRRQMDYIDLTDSNLRFIWRRESAVISMELAWKPDAAVTDGGNLIRAHSLQQS